MKPLNRRMTIRRDLRLVYKRMPRLEGPKATTPEAEAIDDLLASIYRKFDISPILSGDNFQARIVADDLFEFVVAEARREVELGAPYKLDDVIARWSALAASQDRSMKSFRRVLTARVTSSS